MAGWGADHDFKFGVQYVIGNHSSHGGYTPGPNYPGGVVYYDNGDGSPNYILLGTNYNTGGEFRETGVFAEDVINIGNRGNAVRRDPVRPGPGNQSGSGQPRRDRHRSTGVRPTGNR